MNALWQDVDIYISAYQCLDWMLANKLIIESTIVRYDDWPDPNSSDVNSHNYAAEYGEARAHREITKKYQIIWKHLRGYGRTSKYTYQVKSIGKP